MAAEIIYTHGGYAEDSPFGTRAGNLIKIGWSEFYQKNGKDHRKPLQLRGILLTSAHLGNDKHPVPLWQEMERLGYSKEKVKEGIDKHRHSSEGCLPREIDIAILYDAIRSEETGRWTFPGTWAAQLEDFDAQGLFCSGDGCTAKRRQADGTRKEIVCNPVGKPGITDPKEICEYSAKGECGIHGRFICNVLAFNTAMPQDWPRWKSLVPVSGRHASTYRFDPGGKYLDGISKELIRASDALDGHIRGLTGLMTFSMERMNSAKGPQILPSMVLRLDPSQIAYREKELWNRFIEGKRAEHGLLPAPTEITATELDADDVSEDEAEIIGADPGNAGLPTGSSSPAPTPAQTQGTTTAPATHPTAPSPAPPPPGNADLQIGNSTPSPNPHSAIPNPQSPALPDLEAEISPPMLHVADASPEDLVEALNFYLAILSEEENKPVPEISRRVCIPVTIGDKSFGVPDPAAYLRVKGDDVTRARAIAALRETCAKIEAANDRRFAYPMEKQVA